MGEETIKRVVAKKKEYEEDENEDEERKIKEYVKAGG